ncbi:MAG: hypothetical protein WCC60_19505 [Ilumatobacteraceae bacterium]
MNVRRLTLATVVLAAAGFSACTSQTKASMGDGSTPSVVDTASTVPGQVTTLPGVVTTVVGDTAPPATAPPATAPPATAPPATAPPATAPPATAPPATAPPATAPPATQPPAPGLSLYDEVNRPRTPSTHTDPFASSGTLGNGTYWVIYSGGETMTPTIDVVQAFFGAECEAQAVAHGEECLNDIYVLNDPSREIDSLPFAGGVYLTVSSSNTQRSYWITPDELRSVRASSASDPAPADFSFSSFPFLMTVQGGQITKFEQVWVP